MNKKRENPFIEISNIHNVGVDFVIEKLKNQGEFESKTLTHRKILETTSDYLSTIIIKNEKLPKNIIQNILINSKIVSYNKSIDKIFSIHNVPAELIAYAKEVEGLSNNLSPEIFLENLLRIEKKILESECTAVEIQYPLLYVSIAIASLKYWRDKKLNPDKYKRPTPLKPHIIITLSKADAKGAIIGGGAEKILIHHITTILVAGHSIISSVEKYLDERKKQKEL